MDAVEEKRLSRWIHRCGQIKGSLQMDLGLSLAVGSRQILEDTQWRAPRAAEPLLGFG
jgi:hypothetical protein